ncbi:holin family protein [Paenibacillus thailandensis]|uniref:Holin family protein n=1 Tax=Paenibacillus thailandensis TaxID=393250 RepID=A0ABW5QZ67_9BACL
MPLVMVCSVSGLLGAVVTFSFGMWTEALTFLLCAMGVDYITGIAAALREGKGLNSGVGFWGLARKGLILLVILLAHRVDVLLQINNMAMGAATYFYITNELISIIENYGRLGLPLPPQLRKIIEVLKEKTK